MSFPGKVIENLGFVSLSCLRTQVLVRVPNFFWIYFWKWDRRLRAGLDRARDVPIGFQVQRLNHWVIIDILTLFVFWWNLIPSVHYFLLALLFDFLLRIVLVIVSKRCRLHVFSRKSNWESLVRQSQLLASTSIGSCSQLLPNYISEKKIERCEQGSNLRRKIPLDFNSNALTTRPSQLFWHYSYFDGIYFHPWTNFCLHYCSTFCWGLSWWSFPKAVAYMSFPGKVIENLWFVSLSCLRTQVLVHVPTFLWIYFWKWDRRLRAGLDRARDVPIGFQVQRLNHWVVIALLTLILFWWNPIPSSDKLLLALIFDFFAEGCRGGRFQTLSPTCPFQEKKLRIFGSSVSVACEYKYWFVFPPNFSGISIWKKRSNAASRVRTCAGNSQWISSPTP